jgi:16S rRNA (uracil1498-N3)-methyltransferase
MHLNFGPASDQQMNLPYFFLREYGQSQQQLSLDEDTSRHIVQVLRMKAGEKLNLTDGKGTVLNTEIISGHKKSCEVRILGTTHAANRPVKITMGVSLLRNNTRFEWFLEKATELGIAVIVPLLCERTIKEKFRFERMQQICISGMLQSQQAWLPELHQPVAFDLLFRQEDILSIDNRFIAHCEGHDRKSLAGFMPLNGNVILLIGPEGDFSPNEISLAEINNFTAVSLGDTRLRTETAAVAAASLLCLV